MKASGRLLIFTNTRLHSLSSMEPATDRPCSLPIPMIIFYPAVILRVVKSRPLWYLQSALQELLVALGPATFSSWVREAISDPTFPRESVTPEAKEEFVAKVWKFLQRVRKCITKVIVYPNL